MTRKVIYVAVIRLTDKVAADWHIDFLIARGVTVEYWDVVSLVREEHAERGARNPQWLRVFRSFEELEQGLRLPENREAFYVMLMSYGGAPTRIFRLLSKYDCRMVRFAAGALPHPPARLWRRLASGLIAPGRALRELASRSKAVGLRRLGLVKPYTITFAAGDACLNGNSYAARVVPINFFDYDRYIEACADACERLVAARYAVFLDSYLPYHSDLEYCGQRRIDPAAYYRSLNRFFGLLERAHRISVVIAAHPRADYAAAAFEGRQVFLQATAALVKDAEFVLSHASTAMSFAVLNRKPLVFIYTAGMAAAYQRWLIREMRGFAEYLDAPLYNVDEISDGRQVVVRPPNPACYERYKYGYLTSRQSESMPTQEIFWREIHAQ